MAVIENRGMTPKVPRLEDIAEDHVRVAYDRRSDTLWVSLTGDPRPAYNVYADDDTMFRIDPDTNEVVGLEIEHFLHRALSLSPEPDGPTRSPGPPR
jgi:uncharacterized protein YuzE